jgi:hypothetical protein
MIATNAPSPKWKRKKKKRRRVDDHVWTLED